MSHLHLEDAEAFHLQQGGKKAMHAGEKLDAREGFAAVCLERAAGVDDVIVRQPVAHRVAYPAGGPPQPGIPALTPPPHHGVVSVQLFDQQWAVSYTHLTLPT